MATAAADSQNRPENSDCSCAGRSASEVMLDALLVAIIGANIMAPEMVDAANAVMARLRGTRWRPEAMSR